MIEIKGNAKLAKKLQKEECNQANLSKKECNKSLRLLLHQNDSKMCSKIDTKPYRKSPAESAKCYEVGQKKRGLDGNFYQVVLIKNGVKRWKKLK